MKSYTLLIALLTIVSHTVSSFTYPTFFSKPSIPTSSTRDKQAISGIKSALSIPKPTLIECEFPPLVELNKLGDGSLRSSLQAEDANVAFVSKLVKEIGVPLIGPKVNVLVSSSASNSFLGKVQSKVKSAVYSLRDENIQDSMGKDDVCVVLTPSSTKDYRVANDLAESGFKTVIVNGLFKVCCIINLPCSLPQIMLVLTLYLLPICTNILDLHQLTRIQKAFHRMPKWPII